MTSIIIAGVARAGKTTLSRRLHAHTGYSHISGDALIATFHAIYPELGITHYDKWDKISRQWEDFIVFYLDRVANHHNMPFIFDTFHLMPEQVARLKLHEKYKVKFIGYPDLTVDEKLAHIRQNPTTAAYYDFTTERTDSQLIPNIGIFIEISKKIQTQCALLGLDFINTSHEFSKTLDDAFAALTRDR